MYGNLTILKKLVEKKTVVDFSYICDETVNDKNIHCLKYLINMGYKIDPSYPLIPNSVTSKIDILKQLLDQGANINAFTRISTFNKKRENALFKILQSYCDKKVVISNIKFLIENGIDVNYQDDEGNTALHIAAKWKNIEAVKAILESGKADTTLKDRQRKVFLDFIQGKKNIKDITEVVNRLEAKNQTV